MRPGRASRRRTRSSRATLFELAVEERCAFLVERRCRARRARAGRDRAAASGRERAAASSRASRSRHDRAARPRARSARAACRFVRAVPARGRAGRRGRGSRARSARGRRAARARGSRCVRVRASTSSSPAVGNREPGAEPKERRLAGSVRPGDEHEAAAATSRLDAAQNALVAVALLHPPCPNHHATVVAPSAEPTGDSRVPPRTWRSVTRPGTVPDVAASHMARTGPSGHGVRAETVTLSSQVAPFGHGHQAAAPRRLRRCRGFRGRSSPDGLFHVATRGRKDADLPRRQRSAELPQPPRVRGQPVRAGRVTRSA